MKKDETKWKMDEEMFFVYLSVLFLILFCSAVLLRDTQLNREVASLRREKCDLKFGKGNWMWNSTINDCVYTENPPVIREIHL